MKTKKIWMTSNSSIAAWIFIAALACWLSRDIQAGCWFPIESISSVEEYQDVRCKNISSIDLSSRPDIPASLWFNRETIWPGPAKMPPGCNPEEIMNNAMNPGFGVRALHQEGITGAGVSVAILDQDLFLDHPEFAGKIAVHHDLGEFQTSMHGPAVASLLVGEHCGTAPGASLYYVSCSQTYATNDYVEGLNWVVLVNQNLPESEKIRVVSISAAPGESPWTYREQYLQARDRAEAAGILVLDVTRYILPCWYDADDPENVAKCTPGFPGQDPWFASDGICVPLAPRTTAEEVTQGDFSYQYTGRGGLSWSIPYVAGVLAMGWQIQPQLTPQQMIDLLFETAYVNPDGAKIINPPAFISLLLTGEPEIHVSAQHIEFFALSIGPNPDPKEFSIANSGLGTLNWEIRESCDWLEAIPSAGTSTGPEDTTTVRLNITSVPPGVHTCTLEICDPAALNNPQKITVTLCVAEPHSTSIQDAIDAANDGDTVIIAPGIYIGPRNRDLDFKGKAITLQSIDPNDPDVVAQTVIYCQGTESEPHRGFDFHSSEGPDSILDGFTITGGYGSFGGAISCHGASPTIRNCHVVNNSAMAGGGMSLDENSNPALLHCVFRANSASWIAGAIRNHTSKPTFINCLITGNFAQFGGAIQNENDSSNPTLVHCILTGNKASSRGGGILNADENLVGPQFRNCILWGNTDILGSSQSSQIYDGFPVINYSCIQGWTGSWGGVGNSGDNPRFVDDGHWQGTSWFEGDYHLQPDSPCRNAGDPDFFSAPGETDFDSEPRIMEGRTDIGCDEFVIPGDFDWNGSLDPADLAILRSSWLSRNGSPNWDKRCDLNKDGKINNIDLLLFRKSWTETH